MFTWTIKYSHGQARETKLVCSLVILRQQIFSALGHFIGDNQFNFNIWYPLVSSLEMQKQKSICWLVMCQSLWELNQNHLRPSPVVIFANLWSYRINHARFLSKNDLSLSLSLRSRRWKLLFGRDLLPYLCKLSFVLINCFNIIFPICFLFFSKCDRMLSIQCLSIIMH